MTIADSDEAWTQVPTHIPQSLHRQRDGYTESAQVLLANVRTEENYRG